MNHAGLSGALLRMERMRQGLMLKQVCQGICVTSYLSKIEHGEAQPDPRILEALFARLGIVYTAEETVLAPLQKLILAYHEAFLYGLDTDEIFRQLDEHDTVMTYSPLCVDWLIVQGLSRRCVLPQLDTLLPCMTEQQRAWRDTLWVYEHLTVPESLDMIRHAADVLGTSSALLDVCVVAFQQSMYSVVHRMESRLTALALAEGNAYVLGCYYEFKGGAYASLDQEALMMDCYHRAIHLLQGTQWKDRLVNIYYNIGATCVAMGKYEQALNCLSKVEESDVWKLALRHKQALACIRSGRVEEGKAWLAVMKEEMDKDGERCERSIRLWYEEAQMECREGFLDDPAYLALLDSMLDLFRKEKRFGFLYFFREQYVQACTRQRQYKKALEFEQTISSVIHNN